MAASILPFRAMPFRLSEITANTAGNAANGPAKVLANPLVAALVVTVLVLVIFLECMKAFGYERPPAKFKLRAGFYSMLAASLVLAMHYYLVDRTVRSSLSLDKYNDTADRIFSLDSFTGGSDVRPSYHVPIQPSSIFSADMERAGPPPPHAAFARPAGAPAEHYGAPARAPAPHATPDDFALEEPDLSF